MSGKDNGGWIRHRGGKCPVGPIGNFEVRLRDGRILQSEDPDQEAELDWGHTGNRHHWEIMAWRPHVATVKECLTVEQANQRAFDECVEKCASDDVMPAAKQDGPLQWRDRILELDAEQKAADESHKSATEARDAERAELVEKLRAEGLALIQAEDMSDPANWQIDDLVEIIGSTNDGWLRYKGMKGHLKYDGDWFVNFGLANEWYLSDNTDIKWHSRPAK